MAGSTKNDGHGGLKADINVTPLVDVVLVLLIIFIVVTPMLTRGKDVQLPMAIAAEAEQEVRDHVVLTVTEDKRIWLDNQNVSEALLASELEKLLLTDRGRELLIKADSSVSVRELRPILQKVKGAGVRRVSFAVLGQKGAAP